jgi:hypothetical protein
LILRASWREHTWDVPLHPGLMIGSAATCDLQIDHDWVNPLHATVIESADGALKLICHSQWSILTLPGSRVAKELDLTHGVRFEVGPVAIQCVAQSMERCERATENEDICCIECGALIAHLPTEARFCPRCGHWLPDDRISFATLMADASLIHRPATLLAYMRAMLTLGMRYEFGREGASCNPEQAMRYYRKVAKLHARA